jgi:hypothetical protein
MHSVLGAVIFSAFFLGCLLGASRKRQNPTEETAYGSGDHDATTKKDKIPRWRRYIHSYLTHYKRNRSETRHHRNPNIVWSQRTFWVVFFYTAVTLALLVVNWQVSGTAKDTEERQLRPYLHVIPGEVTITEFSDNTFQVTMTPIAKIFGQTPAGGINPQWELQIAEFPFNREKFVFGYMTSRSTTNTIMSPGEPTNIYAKTIAISGEDAQQINLGTKRIYADGTVLYYDSFGKGRWTNFCWSRDLQDIKKTERCPIHNSADWNQVSKRSPAFYHVPME